MQLSTLTDIYTTVGECVSAYAPVDTPRGEVEAAVGTLDLAWPALDGLWEAATAATGPDDAGLAVFTWSDRGPLAQGLPAPPTGTVVRAGNLPYGAPLLESLEIAVPHVVVAVGDDESDVVTFGALTEPTARTVATDDAGAFSGLVEAVVDASRSSGAELVVVAAPDRLRSSLTDRLAGAVPIHCEVTCIDPADEDVADATVRLVSDRTARGTVDTLHRFRFARSHDAAVEGVADTIAALQAGRVQLLLVHDDPTDDRTAWIGDGATHIATSANAAGAVGIDAPSEARLVDAAIRSCLLGGGRAHSIPGHLGDGPDDGIGATLAL